MTAGAQWILRRSTPLSSWPAGLDDPEVFEAVRFRDAEDVLDQLFPGRTCTLSAEADVFVSKLVQDAAARALLARRLAGTEASGGLDDVLWVAKAAKLKAQLVEAKGLASSPSEATGSAQGPTATTAWRPCPPGRRCRRSGPHLAGQAQREVGRHPGGTWHAFVAAGGGVGRPGCSGGRPGGEGSAHYCQEKGMRLGSLREVAWLESRP